MDPYASVSHRRNGEDEPYHCSPTFTSDDIVCLGSDTEETPEETQKKRIRYENQAQRCTAGHLPVLLSASLRGPLDRKSGWENPWRYRPRKKKEDEWWQPERLEDMLFTRANVLKRARDYGMGHLTPPQALQWCKQATKDEAEALNGGVMKSIEPVDEEDGHGNQAEESDQGEEDTENNSKDSMDAGCQDEESHTMRQTDPEYSHGSKNYSTTPSHQRDSAYHSENTSRNISGTKRPPDSQWLKGSYVSKRARWEGPAVDSPTPLPGMRPEIRRHGSSRLAVSSTAQLQPTTLQTPAPKRVMSWGIPQEGALPASNVTSKQTNTVSMPHLYSRSIVSSEPTDDMLQQPEEDVDELQEVGRESISAMSFRFGSSIKSQRTPTHVGNQSYSHLEPDDLISSTPRTKQATGNAATDVHSSRSNFANSCSSKLPKIIRHIETDSEFMGEDSFITEVAPSSRDLEKFEYRKKRKRFHESTDESGFGPTDPSGDYGQMEPKAEIPLPDNTDMTSRVSNNSADGDRDLERAASEERESLQDEKVETTTRKSVSGSTKKAEKTQISPGTEIQLIENSATPPRNERSDSSWDMMEDVLHSSSLKRGSNHTPARSDSPHSASPADHHVAAVLSAGRLQKTSSQNSRLSLRSSQLKPPQYHSGSQHRPQESLGAPKKTEFLVAVDQNDISTQSFNTTLSMSARNLIGTIASARSRVTNPREHDVIVIEDDTSEGTSKSGDSESFQDVKMEDAEEQDIEENLVAEPTIVKEHTPISGSEASDGRALELDDTLNTSPSRGTRQTPRNAPTPASGIPNGKRQSLKGGESAEPVIGSAKTPNKQSQVSWQGGGTQSPWVTENFAPLFNIPTAGRSEDQAPMRQSSEQDKSSDQIEEPEPELLEDTDLQQLERPETPANDGIKPFRDFMSPTSSPQRVTAHIDIEDPLRTQELMHAAIDNPWASNMRNEAGRKLKKRVSFGVLPCEEELDSQPEHLGISSSSRQAPMSPPPPRATENFHNEDCSDCETTAINKFGKHFVAARKFKRMLPDMTDSQLNRSPAVGAMAEAFIAADRESSLDQEQRFHSSKSTGRSGAIGWQSHEPQETPFFHSMASSQRGGSRGITAADFDMDEALGEVGDFLEDWSVDAELKKAKDSNERNSTSNGHTRRGCLEL
jgi:hypothetical protein